MLGKEGSTSQKNEKEGNPLLRIIPQGKDGPRGEICTRERAGT